MLYKLIQKNHLIQLGFFRYALTTFPMMGLLFLGALSILLFLFEGVFSMNNGRILEAVFFGVATTLLGWIRLKIIR